MWNNDIKNEVKRMISENYNFDVDKLIKIAKDALCEADSEFREYPFHLYKSEIYDWYNLANGSFFFAYRGIESYVDPSIEERQNPSFNYKLCDLYYNQYKEELYKYRRHLLSEKGRCPQEGNDYPLYYNLIGESFSVQQQMVREKPFRTYEESSLISPEINKEYFKNELRNTVSAALCSAKGLVLNEFHPVFKFVESLFIDYIVRFYETEKDPKIVMDAGACWLDTTCFILDFTLVEFSESLSQDGRSEVMHSSVYMQYGISQRFYEDIKTLMPSGEKTWFKFDDQAEYVLKPIFHHIDKYVNNWKTVDGKPVTQEIFLYAIHRGNLKAIYTYGAKSYLRYMIGVLKHHTDKEWLTTLSRTMGESEKMLDGTAGYRLSKKEYRRDFPVPKKLNIEV